MKKAFSHTKVAVKLRKSPYAEAWFIYLEAYPVYDYEGAKPKRVREYLNRTITTPVWDKNQPTRGKSNGEQHYMPKRDVNGVIQCRSQVDQQSCMYADRVRDTWQHEYDSTALYTEKDAETAAQQEKSRAHFLDYVKFLTYERHKGDSESIIGNWERFLGMLKEFTGKENLQLANGTDIYTVSKMLGHTNVKTTQVYAKVIDSKKDKTTEAINIDADINDI